jgi:hypothetical protein
MISVCGCWLIKPEPRISKPSDELKLYVMVILLLCWWIEDIVFRLINLEKCLQNENLYIDIFLYKDESMFKIKNFVFKVLRSVILKLYYNK